jgi:hypothetical protein
VSASRPEPSSFRDRHAAIFYRDGEVLRGLAPAAKADWDRLARSTFFARAVESGAIVRTEEVAAPTDGGEWAAVLRHERVPFVSYPYEWTFGMLQDAAAVAPPRRGRRRVHPEDGSTTTCSTARGPFHRRRRSPTSHGRTTWPGYRQFCGCCSSADAYVGVRLAASASPRRERDAHDRLLRLATCFGRACSGTRSAARACRTARGIDRRLRDGPAGGVARASWPRPRGASSGRYARRAGTRHVALGGYAPTTRTARRPARRARSSSRSGKSLTSWIGCNIGRFARAAARARYVVAMDSDPRRSRRSPGAQADGGRAAAVGLPTEPEPCWRGASAWGSSSGRPDLSSTSPTS